MSLTAVRKMKVKEHVKSGFAGRVGWVVSEYRSKGGPVYTLLFEHGPRLSFTEVELELV